MGIWRRTNTPIDLIYEGRKNVSFLHHFPLDIFIIILGLGGAREGVGRGERDASGKTILRGKGEEGLCFPSAFLRVDAWSRWIPGRIMASEWNKRSRAVVKVTP